MIAFSADQTADKTENQPQNRTAAIVNGEQITMAELSRATQFRNIMMLAYRGQLPQKFGQFLLTSDAGRKFLTAYRKSVLEDLIEEELQVQKAEEMGIEISEEKLAEALDKRVEQRIQRIISQSKQFKDTSDLDKYLKENQDMTLDEYRQEYRKQLNKESISQNMMIDKLKNEVVGEVNITDEEIQDFYEKNKQSFVDKDGNTKPLSEVRDSIKQSLQRQKETQKWNDWIQKVKEDSEIERKLEENKQSLTQ